MRDVVSLTFSLASPSTTEAEALLHRWEPASPRSGPSSVAVPGGARPHGARDRVAIGRLRPVLRYHREDRSSAETAGSGQELGRTGASGGPR
jgi:hypothetical protein